MNTHYDVIVVGGGHAGSEAALAAARMGAVTLLCTQSLDMLGQLSCNPAVGGIGKSHLVKEIDALGGAMAQVADYAGIHRRVLNETKGPAVRATRLQADRQLYRHEMRRIIDEQPNLYLLQQPVADILVKNGQVTGIKTDLGMVIHAESVVLTAGTFLAGVTHVGHQRRPAGRAGEPPADSLAHSLRASPLQVGRLKTGTPPRIAKNSIDFSHLDCQPSELGPGLCEWRMVERPKQVDCHITHTNTRTHEIIAENLDQSAMYGGQIEGVGPRYCPSIEDKIHRFADKSQHQIFIEPEGIDVNEVYPNGISTSLPFDVQLAMIRSIKGFEQAHITRPGYAIEYDYFDPRSLHPWLETQVITGLFFAGQINGTTGYEEAAAQGIVAGINAALKANRRPVWYPTREESYIGVMVDDLVCNGVTEPYRMFTSRAEHRLMLREDNADMRLTSQAMSLGLIKDEQWQAFETKKEKILMFENQAKDHLVSVDSALGQALDLKEPKRLLSLMKRPDYDSNKLDPEIKSNVDVRIQDHVQTNEKYAGYITRHQTLIEKKKALEQYVFPKGMDFTVIPGLSTEAIEKLTLANPTTLGQASRVAGVTAASVDQMLIYLRKTKLQKASETHGDRHVPTDA